MTKENTIRNIILLILVVLLMIAIYISQQGNPPPIFIPTPSSFPTPTPFLMPVRTLTPEEQGVLKIPLHYASQTEKTKHTQDVAKLARTAPELNITSCTPNPVIYQVSLKESFKITNNDPVPHTLRYMSSQIMVPAYGSTTIKTSNLFKIAGDYGYGCDNPFAKHGVLMVR